MTAQDFGHIPAGAPASPQVCSRLSLREHGWRALEFAVFAGPALALIGPAASDIYLIAGSIAFLLWRLIVSYRPEYDLTPDAGVVDERPWYAAPWFLAAVAFWIWTNITALSAMDPVHAFRDSIVWIRFPVFAMAIWVVVGRSKILRTRLLQGVMLGAAVMTAILLVERISYPERPRLFGPWPDAPKPGWYMLGYGLPLALWAMVWIERQAMLDTGVTKLRRNILAIILVSLLPIATLATGEMMNTLLFFFGLLLFTLVGGVSPKRCVALGALLLGAFGVILLLNEHIFWHYTEGFFMRLPWVPTSDYHPAWAGSLNMGLQEWFVGVGPGGFRDACRAMGPETLGVTACLSHPHQAYLQMFSETGLPGLLLFATMAALLTAYAYRRWRQSRNIEAVAALVIIVVMFLPLSTYANAFGQHKNFFTWFATGWALVMARSASPRRPAPESSTA